MINKYLFVLCFSFIYSIILGQQTKTDTLSYQIDSVVVSASRFEQPIYQIPFSIDVIDSQALNTLHESLSAEKIFSSIPGVIVNNRSNLSEGDKIIIRGVGSRSQFGVRGIKILLDGIPLTFADGQSQLNNLDLNSIGRIEVIRGPSSFLYGNSAGGVIYIQSKDINSKKLSINPSFSFGSFGLKKYGINASGKIYDNSLYINFSKMNYAGFRENSAVNTTSLNIISTQNFSVNTKLRAVFNYFDAPYLLNPSSLTKADAENNPAASRDFVKQQGAGKKISQGQGGLIFSYQPTSNQKLEVTFYGISRSMLNPIPGRVIRLNRHAGGIRSNCSVLIPVAEMDFRILSGIDYEFQNDVRTEFANNGLINYKSVSNNNIIESVRLGSTLLDQNEKVNGLGAFSKIEFSPVTKLAVSFGLRYNNYNFNAEDKLLTNGNNSGSRRMDNISKMIGLVYSINNNIRTYANFSTSFQTPTTSELSNSQDGSGGFNMSLEPELLQNFEIGIRGNLFNGRLFYHLSMYKLITDNVFIPYQLPGSQSDEVFFKNSGGAVNNGIEFSLEWVPFDQFYFEFAYTYSGYKFTDFVEEISREGDAYTVNIGGNHVPGVPQNYYSLTSTYRLPFGLITKFSLNRSGQYYVNDTNGQVPNSNGNLYNFINNAYITADINFDYKIDFDFADMGLFLGVNNLFNEKYNGSIVPNASGDRFFEPAAPRNWTAGISFEF